MKSCSGLVKLALRPNKLVEGTCEKMRQANVPGIALRYEVCDSDDNL